MKMSSFNDNFIITQCCDNNGLSDSENFMIESRDPLLGLITEVTPPKCYKIDSVVFAEPLKIISAEENTNSLANMEDKTNKEEFTFIENVMVQNRAGKKYKKYHINIGDPTCMECPQPNCARTFSSTKLLKAHIRKVHCADKNKYICERCGSGFSAQYLLDRHIMVHRNEKVECPVCGIMLSCRTSLSSHLRCHSNVRPHQCEVCSKSFSRPSTLATHVKFVHRDSPLQCDQCEVRFSSRKKWSQHVTSHKRKKADGSTSQKP